MNLNRRICPGCGKENPKSIAYEKAWFECAGCGWERCGRLPEVATIVKAKRMMTDCRNVNLPAFLRTLLKEEKP